MTYLEWFLEGLVALTLFPWFVQQSGTFQKLFLLLFAGWGFEGGGVTLKDTQASLWAPRLVPVNTDLAPAKATEQSKSFLLAFILVLFGVCLHVSVLI